jgi:hypothetical protein
MVLSKNIRLSVDESGSGVVAMRRDAGEAIHFQPSGIGQAIGRVVTCRLMRADMKELEGAGTTYNRLMDVYGIMGILRMAQETEFTEDARFLAVIVDCKSVGKIDTAEIFSISVAGKENLCVCFVLTSGDFVPLSPLPTPSVVACLTELKRVCAAAAALILQMFASGSFYFSIDSRPRGTGPCAR